MDLFRTRRSEAVDGECRNCSDYQDDNDGFHQITLLKK